MSPNPEVLVRWMAYRKFFRLTKWRHMRFPAFTWKSATANLSRLPDLPAAASRRCFPSSAFWIHRPKAATQSTARRLLAFLFPSAAASVTGKLALSSRHSI